MRTSDFGDFDEALLESSKNRNWLLVGLMISLAFHGALCGYFYRTNFMPARNLLEERIQTPTFKVKNLDMQPLDKPSQDQLNPAAKPDPDKTDVQLPDEKKSFDQLLQDGTPRMGASLKFLIPLKNLAWVRKESPLAK